MLCWLAENCNPQLEETLTNFQHCWTNVQAW